MATAQLTSAASSISAKGFASFEGLRASSAVKVSSFSPLKQNVLSLRSFRGLVVKAATAVAPKRLVFDLMCANEIYILLMVLQFSTFSVYSLKPLGDRVLVKIKTAEEKTSGGILLPTTAQSKPQAGEVVAVGEGRTVGKNKVEIGVKTGTQVVYSKYAGTEVEFSGSNHLILKEDDMSVAEAEEKTAGGLYLTDASKEKPSIGAVVAVGPGPLDEEGNRKPLSVAPGNTVLYSKYAGNDFKGADGSEYIALRASDVMAILS
ncbi:chaperonin, chloroplastic [Sesamum angolense]|uniref:20 kDa chaperonin, chloroplastic n=1 Tax=Sesamum angolense TaxID=2727404 RepID=A0AAE1WEN1_9LAMI|nr:chaperonin, chloroplastic [Sesamum angolense]